MIESKRAAKLLLVRAVIVAASVVVVVVLRYRGLCRQRYHQSLYLIPTMKEMMIFLGDSKILFT